jgi:drug/metabolite transporter (DMT)-like permease
MAISSNFLIAISLGIISSSMIHLAKSMERHGIEVLDKVKAKLTKTEDTVQEGGKKSTIYIVGLILNQTPPLWAFLVGLTGAPMSYYTSVYGLGMIVSLIYSSKVLKEKILPIEKIGAGILISGTLLLGIDGVLRPTLSYAEVNVTLAFIIIGIVCAIGLTGMAISLKSKSKLAIGITFGLLAGCLGSLDPVLKGIGQNLGGSGGIPSGTAGWLIFLLSFLMGAGAFLTTQWAFAHKVDSIVIIPAINSTYVALPIIIQAFILPNFDITWLTVLGIAVTICGIFLMTYFKGKVQQPQQAEQSEQQAIAE